MADGVGERSGGPGVDGIGVRKLGEVDFNHGGVGDTEGFPLIECRAIDFFDCGYPVATPFSKADQFFEPGGAGGLKMQTGAGVAQSVAHRTVDREFVGR